MCVILQQLFKLQVLELSLINFYLRRKDEDIIDDCGGYRETAVFLHFNICLSGFWG